MMWLSSAVLSVVLLLAQQTVPVMPLAQPSFEEWLGGVRAEALTRGISQATLDRALTGLEPLPIVIERDRTQAELVQTLDQYLARRLSKKVVKTAGEMRQIHEDLLKQVADKYGVPAGILGAVWGLESNFGRFSGVRPTIPTLATPAYAPRRSSRFMLELVDPRKVLDSAVAEPPAVV